MKKILLSLLFLTGMANAQIITFADANFKTALTSSNCVDITGDGFGDQDADLNDDGEIQSTEALAVTRLYLPNHNITSLSGIAGFTNLVFLNCSSNEITSINMGDLAGLKTLRCNINLMTSLNTTVATQLEYLDCSQNGLTSLNVTGLANLTFLSFHNNNLSSVNLSSQINVETLYTSANEFTSIDLSALTQLENLYMEDNPITALNVSMLTNLKDFRCPFLDLTSLDVGNLTNLETFEFGNTGLGAVDVSALANLTYIYMHLGTQSTIDLSNLTQLTTVLFVGTQLTSLDLSVCPLINSAQIQDNLVLEYVNMKNGGSINSPILNCPALLFICANENNIAAMNASLINGVGNNPNAHVNSYCTFIPGGNYNTITGAILLDANNDGCGGGDIVAQNVRVNLNDGTNQGATFTGPAADYLYYTGAGNFTITPQLENPGYFNLTPGSSIVNFPIVNNSLQTRNFCLTANGIHPDAEIVLVPVIAARPGFPAFYKVVYRNKGNQILSGTITVAFDDSRMEFVYANPAVQSQSTNLLTWSYSNLQPFETRAINFNLDVNAPTAIPPVNDGDTLPFTVTQNYEAAGGSSESTSFVLNQIVTNSLDPNDKTCLEGTTVSPEKIGEYLHYNINFENTGTADAVNIVVKDIVNTDQFDINTLQVTYASHAVRTVITGNVVEFIFEDINLPPSATNNIGGHGNVLFKIKTRNDLTVGSVVTNLANIYFDYNHPVETNEARTTFATLDNPEFTKDNSVGIYPNPAQNKVNIKADSNIKSVQIFDIQGRILETVLENKNNTSLDVSGKSNGIYFLKVTTEKGSKVEKLVKE